LLRHQLIHPKINEILGRAGHHAKILLADGNYPASSKKGLNAELVCLNLSPGVVTVAQALAAVVPGKSLAAQLSFRTAPQASCAEAETAARA
jgi:L-fucose mutarotase